MPAGASLELVSLRDACLAARRAMRESGLLCGIESGAAIVAATRHAPARDSAVAVAVAVLGDSALRHRSTLLNDTWLLENDIYDEHMHAQLGHKYRGASVEDLQLPEALCIFETQPVSDAMDMMVSRDYSQLPVINAARKVVGLVSLGKLSADLDSGDLVDLSEPIAGRMYSFARNSEPYRIISPTTPLTDLEAFFERHPAAIVTDESAKFPLAVVTKLDLMRFLAKRGVEP
ncbi:hypothetical protein HK105_204072 [Polyrhizophydium stewartii]|uniref:CBS domain-containing protein n=1 Tax=Polyrhizophydium stewartii TaxID=2732419 RepID=A0ABR4N9V0_9FUNG